MNDINLLRELREYGSTIVPYPVIYWLNEDYAVKCKGKEGKEDITPIGDMWDNLEKWIDSPLVGITGVNFSLNSLPDYLANELENSGYIIIDPFHFLNKGDFQIYLSKKVPLDLIENLKPKTINRLGLLDMVKHYDSRLYSDVTEVTVYTLFKHFGLLTDLEKKVIQDYKIDVNMDFSRRERILLEEIVDIFPKKSQTYKYMEKNGFLSLNESTGSIKLIAIDGMDSEVLGEITPAILSEIRNLLEKNESELDVTSYFS